MKKLFSLLLVLCLIVGLLPVVASAAEYQHEDSAKIRVLGKFDLLVQKGGPAKYARTTEHGEPITCSESDDWNIKFEYVDDWAVLTLKGAKLGEYDKAKGQFYKEYMQKNHAFEAPPNSPCYQLKVVIEEDSTSAVGYSFLNCQGTEGDPWITNVMIESVGDAKLTTYCGGATMYFCNINARGTLTINANLDLTNDMDYKTAVQLSAPEIIINGGNVKLQSSNSCIANNKSLTINGGNVTMSTDNGAVLCPLNAPDSTVTINGGTVKLLKTEDGGGGAIKAEKLVINGGNVYGEGYTYGVNAAEVEINGGVVELYARSDEGDAQAFIDAAPSLNNFTDAAAVLGISKDDVAKYDPDNTLDVDTNYFKVAKAGTADAPEVPADEPEPTEPPATEPPATEPPATEPPATSETPDESKDAQEETKRPEESKDNAGNNNGDNNDNNDGKTDDGAKEGNSDWILWVVAAAFVVAAGVVVVVIVIKNKAGDEEDEEEE